MADGMKGWGALGEVLGGGIGTPGAYEDGLKEGYTLERALHDARRAKARALIDSGRAESRQSVTPELLQSALGGDISAQATLAASVLGGNQTMNLGQLGEYQRPHYGQNINAAQEAILGGDAATYNRMNAAALGDEYQPVQVLGGAYVPDGMTLDNFTAIPTPEVLSRIQENEAQAQAATTRANRPPTTRASTRAPSAASAEADVLAQARAAISQGADVDAVKSRLQERGYSKLAGRL